MGSFDNRQIFNTLKQLKRKIIIIGLLYITQGCAVVMDRVDMFAKAGSFFSVCGLIFFDF